MLVSCLSALFVPLGMSLVAFRGMQGMTAALFDFDFSCVICLPIEPHALALNGGP